MYTAADGPPCRSGNLGLVVPTRGIVGGEGLEIRDMPQLQHVSGNSARYHPSSFNLAVGYRQTNPNVESERLSKCRRASAGANYDQKQSPISGMKGTG